MPRPCDHAAAAAAAAVTGMMAMAAAPWPWQTAWLHQPRDYIRSCQCCHTYPYT